jgi:hypothetical protein
VEEFFAAGDPRFVEQLRQFHDAKRLAPFADRWARDFRPWARLQIFEYLEQPLDRPGHQPLVKRLFKGAEAKRDDALVGAFVVAFDRLVRRVRKKRYRYDWQARQSWVEEILYAPRNNLAGRTARNLRTGAPIHIPPRNPAGARLFSYHTRYYLRRRAWRYFRRMGHQRPNDYCPAVATFLAGYDDADLQKGENLLDSWGLVHACFGDSDVLEFTASAARLKEGRSLGDLAPAPYFPKLWSRAEAAPLLLVLAGNARSRLVRVWAMTLARRDHADHLAGLRPADLLPLLDSEDEAVQQFGAELLERAAGLETLPLTEWLRLLQTRNLIALETIAAAMRRHVDPARLSLFEAVTLACAEPVPVARIGLEFVKALPLTTPQARQAISNLARAKCPRVGREIAAWALSVLGRPEVYDVEQVVRFFDSLLAEMRQAAWEWLTAEGSPGWDDPGLWSRLLETPYDDLRLRMIEVLQRRATLPGTSPDDLAPLWSAVLLGVHRGGRQKLTALRQISDAVRRDPARAERLLPVLAVAIRSVRAPEARAGLAAIVGAVEETPALADVVRRFLPELNLSPEGASA